MTRAPTDRVDAARVPVRRGRGQHPCREGHADASRGTDGARRGRTIAITRLRGLPAAGCAALLLALAAGISARAQVPTGDPVAGRAIVQAQCSTCHAGPGFGGPLRQGPSLQAVANMPSTTSTSLHVFLMTPHPTMPNYRLSAQEIDDVVAYILSLRR